MLYIFDLGNVIIDIDFNRALGVWSDLGRVPLAALQKNFHPGEAFEQHERGEISDEIFAGKIGDQLGLALSFEQFKQGWLAIFIRVHPEIIALMQQLRTQGHRVVVLSNTNMLHTDFWQAQHPEVRQAADHLYLSQEMRLRKPEPAIYQQVLASENMTAKQAVFFDDNEQNILAARALGIESVQVTSTETVLNWFAERP
ncbi:glucose-1-phosphatase [Enterobacteriaceae bacterium LUAb1]